MGLSANLLICVSGLSVFAAEAKKYSVRVVTFGTSLTERGEWHQALASRLEQFFSTSVEVVNLGKSSAASDWGVKVIQQVIDARPDIVIIEFSANDSALHRGVSLAQSQTNVRVMVKRIQSNLPTARVFLMTMNPVHGIQRLVRPLLGMYYKSYQILSQELNIGFIDNRPGWDKLSYAELKSSIPDGIHPNPVVAANIIVPNIVVALGSGHCRA